jgi:hypothetical protein
MIAVKSNSDQHKRSDQEGPVFMRKSTMKTRTQIVVPSGPLNFEHLINTDEDNETVENFLPPEDADYKDDMDEHYSTAGSFQANHFSKMREGKTGQSGMTGMLKFFNCCGDR